MPPIDPDSLTQALRQIEDQVKILVLVTGTLTDNRTHYAYVSMPPSKYQAFKLAEASGAYDLADYGTILAHGDGLEPPADVMRKMEEEHGADHMLESQLNELMANFSKMQ